jgi:hypothetical protein
MQMGIAVRCRVANPLHHDLIPLALATVGDSTRFKQALTEQSRHT